MVSTALQNLKKTYRRFKEIQRKEGSKKALIKMVSFMYREYIRRVMPVVGYLKRNKYLSGGEEIKLGDKYLPSSFTPSYISSSGPGWSIPKYEDALSDALRQHVKRGDRILIVGGGKGITSCIAARKAGTTGSVYVFEASKEMVDHIHETLRLNGVAETCKVKHAVVGEAVSVEDGITGPLVRPKTLPNCDIMELDCEGAECDILRKMIIYPRTLIVETHGVHGSSTKAVKRIMEENGYKVEDERVADSREERMCKKKDIMVLIGQRDEQ